MHKISISEYSFSLHKYGSDWLMLKPVDVIPKLAIATIAESIYKQKILGIQEVICGVEDISLMISSGFNEKDLKSLKFQKNFRKIESYNLVVDFEKGLDWEVIEKHSKLKKADFIHQICSKDFVFSMSGFLPGFIYLDGLETGLGVPRKEMVRPLVPANSLGIGGSQIGIYTMPSPGGWNLIGECQHSFFDPNTTPPLSLQVGDKIKFIPKK